MQGIAGKSVVITGASRGIGYGVAESFVKHGAHVTIMAETDGVHAAAKHLGARGFQVDVTDKKAVGAALAETKAIDILINNAGLERITPVDGNTDENLALFKRIMDINVVGMAIVTSHALPRMAYGSRIINTASIWGRTVEPLFGAYVASKHAVIGLTKTWAKELGPRGIRVNAVAPGWVRTEASIRSAETLAARSGRDVNDIIASVEAAQPLAGGLMEPQDIAGAYLFLASDLSANITGQTLGIDRGEVPY